MANSPVNRVVRQLRWALLVGGDVGRTDAQLLERFVALRDEAAFAELVRRHGPMVRGVCRRTAGHADDADDAFQAVFLVLARKAASIRAPARLAAWLYGVACRTARKARADADRRRARERQVRDMPQPPAAADDRWEELLPLLDRELSRLPDKYRVPIILCDLEGVSRKEAARKLGVPEGTLSSRLATGRRTLARRLAHYGAAVSGGALAALLVREASATVPATLAASTVRAALGSGAASAQVIVLAEGVVKAMLWMKLKVAAVVVLTAGLLLVGAGAAGPAAGKDAAPDPSKVGPAKTAADDAGAKEPDAAGKDAVWVLDFRFKGPRTVNVDVPGRGKKLVWYLPYTVANPTDQEHSFIPDFELLIDNKEVHHDQTPPPAVRNTIEQLEDPAGALGRLHFKDSATIAAEPLPAVRSGAAPEPVNGVAVWNDLDPNCNLFSIYVAGLSNGWVVDDEGRVRRKTLRLDFRRKDGGIELAGPVRWLYRTSKDAPPEPADQSDELRRTVADLRKQLDEARAAAAVTDKDKALAEKEREITDLRDQLTAAQIQVRALTTRCQELEEKIERLQKAKEEKEKKDDASPPAPADAPHIEGVVTKTADSLAIVSVGSDAGVAVGMTLEVYRLNPPTYLGGLRIIEVRNEEAVGKPVRTPADKTIQAGDKVTSAPVGK